MVDILFATEAFGDFLVKGVMTDHEAKTIFDSLEYAFQLYSLGRQLFAASPLDEEAFDGACKCFEGSAFDNILKEMVRCIRRADTPIESEKRGGTTFAQLYKLRTGEDDLAVKAAKESVVQELTWLEDLAFILTTDYALEEELCERIINVAQIARAFMH